MVYFWKLLFWFYILFLKTNWVIIGLLSTRNKHVLDISKLVYSFVHNYCFVEIF